MSDYIDYSYKASSRPRSMASSAARKSQQKPARKPVNYDDEEEEEEGEEEEDEAPAASSAPPAKEGSFSSRVPRFGNGSMAGSAGGGGRSNRVQPPVADDEDNEDDDDDDDDDYGDPEDDESATQTNNNRRIQAAREADGGEIDSEGSVEDMGYPPKEGGGRRNSSRQPSVARSRNGGGPTDYRRRSLGARQGLVVAGLGGDSEHDRANRPTYVPQPRHEGGAVGRGRPAGALNPETGGESRPAGGVDPTLSKRAKEADERLREQEKDPEGMGLEGVDVDEGDDYDEDDDPDDSFDHGTSRSGGRRSRGSRGGRHEMKEIGRGSRGSQAQGGYGRSSRGAPAYPSALWEHLPPNYPAMSGLTALYYTFWKIQSFIITSMSFLGLATIALTVAVMQASNPFHKNPPKPKVDKSYRERITGERYSLRTEYYCKFWGYGCDQHEVETADGFMLRLYRVTRPGTKPGYPVLIMHGILCNSTYWVVNEERSLAFWLAEQGYDVWIGNIRSNFKMPHKTYKRNDPRYWAWAVRELGIYDHTAMIDYVTETTGFPQLAFIGHSQGSAAMFMALANEQRPDIGQKMSSFCALGPAVYAGPVLRRFPFSILRLVSSRFLWSKGIGVTEFIPILSLFQTYFPGWLFGHIAFPVFAFMFRFHETYLLPRQFPKLFRGVPIATSSELLYFYMASFAEYGCMFDVNVQTPWFPPGFPPLAIFYGTMDYLVLGGESFEIVS